jgi:hypothetical protein
MKKAVFCIAQNIEQAEHIVNSLKFAGFSNNDISVLLPDKSGTKDFAHEKHTKAPEGAAIGGSRVLAWVQCWDCWRASAVWPFPESAH